MAEAKAGTNKSEAGVSYTAAGLGYFEDRELRRLARRGPRASGRRFFDP